MSAAAGFRLIFGVILLFYHVFSFSSCVSDFFLHFKASRIPLCI